MTRRTYENKQIRVYWDSDKCIHAENCVVRLPSVFDRERRKWVDLDAAPAEDIRSVIGRCPSGALRCESLGPATEADAVTVDGLDTMAMILAMKDGPYQVKGRVRLVGTDGMEIKAGEVCCLCRCGRSAKKPFCDGAHADAGFKD